MGVLKKGIGLIGEAVRNDIMKLLGNDASARGATGKVITLTQENCYSADDLLQELEASGNKDWLFLVGPDMAGFDEDSVFHLEIFFDKLAKFPAVPADKKIYYRHVARCLSAEEPVPSFAGFIGLSQVAGRFRDFVLAARRQNACMRSLKPVAPAGTNPAEKAFPSSWQKVMITGWYGTETTGDKAILAELVRFIRERSPSCRIALTTIDEKISRKTNKEVEGLADAELVDIARGADPGIIERCDAVIVGGGPLMQSDSMGFIRKIFLEANRRKKARVIFGCGMGPFHTREMETIAADLLRLSTAGFFRDAESLELAQKLAPENSFGVACDPALGYLERWLKNNTLSPSEKQRPVIATLLRANTNEFVSGSAKSELESANRNCARTIAEILEKAAGPVGAEVKMLAMNAPWIGGDDRIFNRIVAASFGNPENVRVERGYSPMNAVIRSLAGADTAMAMRYHGHLFCLALGIPFLSVDYTGRSGKISNLLKRINYERWTVRWNEMDPHRAAGRLRDLLDEREHWAGYLAGEYRRLLRGLKEIYVDMSGPADRAQNSKQV